MSTEIIFKAAGVIGSLLLFLYLAMLVLLYVFQDKLLFPAPGEADFALPEPAAWVEMKTPDGESLKHIHLRNEAGSPKVLFFHGNGSLAFYELQRGMDLHRAGFDVLLAEYRGYGGSTGSPSAKHLLADGVVTYDWFKGDYAGPLFLYAHSLGTGIATHIAAQREVASIVLESPYTSLAELAASKYPIFPVRTLFKHEIGSDISVQQVQVPLRIIHGERDAIIPVQFGRELFALSASNDKEMEIVSGAGHNDLPIFGSVETAIEFLVSRQR